MLLCPSNSAGLKGLETLCCLLVPDLLASLQVKTQSEPRQQTKGDCVLSALASWGKPLPLVCLALTCQCATGHRFKLMWRIADI